MKRNPRAGGIPASKHGANCVVRPLFDIRDCFLAGYASGSYVVRVELLTTSFSAAVSSGRSGSTVDAAGVDSLVQLFRSETALRRVARASRPSLTPEAIASASEVRRIPDSGLVRIQVQGSVLQGAVDLANTYGAEASAAAREIWLSQCQELNREVAQRLASVDEQLAQTSREWGEFQRQTLGTDFSGDEGSALRRLCSKSRIMAVVFITASGLSEMLSMPCPTENFAKSG